MQEVQSSNKRKIVLAIVFILLLLVSFIGGAALYVSKCLSPMPAQSESVHVTIPQGASSSDIAVLLEQKGLIRDARIFTYYLKYKKQGAKFQAGEYAMPPGITLDQIITKLNQGDTVKEEVIRVTIPEGFTVTQIADKLAQASGLSAAAFLDKADRSGEIHSASARQIPANPAIKHRLEGYIFPETYEFRKGTSEDDMLDRMLSELDNKLAALPSDWQDKLKQKSIDFHQMLTIASLVEREVALDEERPIVAGVIYNRLSKKMPLQIDATIQYLFDKPKDRLVEKDLQIESPYNTYLHAGLPPGPIASPSLASIKAAIYPADTKYLFYVTKKDGSKGHLFAETFEQHKKNIEASKTQEGK
jgi:UPF0755 protein